MKRIWKLVSTRGRIGRLRYFWLSLLLGLVELGLCAALLAVIWAALSLKLMNSILLLCVALMICPWFIWSVLVSIALYVKRFHDINMSGWYCLWMSLAGGSATALNESLACHSLAWKSVSIGLSVICWVLDIMLLLKPGSKGQNRFGERLA
ncbi:MAG: DUF805 domain-containing protein [Puniceicoccales bacterium]|jgi:uncharacterized membrane protein YhaH (DUF805 family)|nr:DUF805 domain-containing protein [Puniceicoccales bacterium]